MRIVACVAAIFVFIGFVFHIAVGNIPYAAIDGICLCMIGIWMLSEDIRELKSK